MELSLQQRLAAVYETYTVARNQVERYRDTMLPAADEALKLSRKMYQAGESNFVAVLTAQRTFAETNSNYLDSVLRLRTAETVMKGLLLSGSLDGGADTGIPTNTSTADQRGMMAPLLLNR